MTTQRHSIDMGKQREPWRRLSRVFVYSLVASAAVFGINRAMPHLFPQYDRLLWGEFGAPLERDVPPALADLPVVYYDGHDADGPVAIVLSGNGGWWGLCGQLAEQLAGEHITTIGLNSLAYFVEHRTPADIAVALERMASTVAPTRPIMLLGYSYGADVIATIYSELDPALRDRIQLVSLMGLTRDVNYGIGFWQIASEKRQTAPLVAKIAGPAIQCFVGSDEGAKSACHALDPQTIEIIELPGGHHFGGDYQALASHVIDSWKRRTAARGQPPASPG